MSFQARQFFYFRVIFSIGGANERNKLNKECKLSRYNQKKKMFCLKSYTPVHQFTLSPSLSLSLPSSSMRLARTNMNEWKRNATHSQTNQSVIGQWL